MRRWKAVCGPTVSLEANGTMRMFSIPRNPPCSDNSVMDVTLARVGMLPSSEKASATGTDVSSGKVDTGSPLQAETVRITARNAI